jgi:hypothetical protein
MDRVAVFGVEMNMYLCLVLIKNLNDLVGTNSYVRSISFLKVLQTQIKR